MTIYFVSDIHLEPSSPEITKLFLDFLHGAALQAKALYILGDMFAIWFGDDLDYSFAADIITALNKLHENNIPVYFMPGNRDFLIGKKFCKISQMQLLPDPLIITPYDKPLLLTHGDLLCSHDIKYQRFRKFVQHPITKRVFLWLPQAIRVRIGNWVRQKTKQRPNQEYIQNSKIYDAAPETVQEWFNKYNVSTIIHGHTHRPAVHGQDQKQRIVLGDWSNTAAYILKLDESEFHLENLVTCNCSITRS